MIQRNEGGPPEPVGISTIDMLRALCERQGDTIRQLSRDRDDAEKRLSVAAEELRAAGKVRQDHLAALSAQVSILKARTERILKERDAVANMLRALVVALTPQDEMTQPTTFFRCEVEVYRHAREVVQIIDTAEQATANKT